MAGKEKLRVLIGTRKGGYIAESDASRKKWSVKGPIQPGREVFHMSADPRHPGDVYACVNSGFWGPMLFRSSNWGKSWSELAPPNMKVQSERKPLFSIDGSPPPVNPIVNVWHLEPGHATEPDTVFLGIDPASLFRSDDRGKSWAPVTALNEHSTRSKWGPGAGGLCLHTIMVDPERPRRMIVGISAAGAFRTDDAGEHWTPMNRGVLIDFLPDKSPEVGQCVHKMTFEPSNSTTVYRQDHNGIHVSRDGAESWTRVGKVLPHDFGFVVAAAPAMPGGAFFVPLHSENRISLEGGLRVYRWSEKTKKFTKTVRTSQFPGELGTHREALSTDTLDPAGVYLGTTTGQLLYSRDGTKSWGQIPYDFPSIHSVHVATSK